MPLAGTISGVYGEGGLITLDIQLPSGTVIHLHGDNGPTVRALHEVYGNVITPGHSFAAAHLVGKPIEFDVDPYMPALLAVIYPLSGSE